LWRRFQSNAVFSAFSTAGPPPSTKNRCGSAGSPDDPREHLDEPRHRHAVDVGVRRLVHRHLGELGQERRVVDERGRVHPERRGGEEAEQVEVAGAVAGVHDPGAVRGARVEHEVEAVDEQVAAQGVVDVLRVHARSVLSHRPAGTTPSVGMG
jgi:hypothetical protein